MSIRPRYPHVVCSIDLNRPGGSIYAIIGRIRGEMRRARIPNTEIEAFTTAVASTRSYADALRVCGEWVTMPDRTADWDD